MRITLFAVIVLLALSCSRDSKSYRLMDKGVEKGLSEKLSLIPLWEGTNGFYLSDSTSLQVVIQDRALYKIIRVFDKDSTFNTVLFSLDASNECSFDSCYNQCLSAKGGRDGNGSCYFECYACRISDGTPAPELKEY